jgi:ketosteroid isomerase-like protein
MDLRQPKKFVSRRLEGRPETPIMSKIILTGIVLIAFSILAPARHAQTALETRTPQQVVEHHWAAFSGHDVEAVLSDYTDDAIFIAPKQTVQGKDALRRMFESFLGGSGAGNSNTPAPVYEATVTSDGDVGYEHWISNPGKPGSMEGTDAFVVRHGKILFHTAVFVHPQELHNKS